MSINTLDTRDLEKRRQELQEQHDTYKEWEEAAPQVEDFETFGAYEEALDSWKDDEPLDLDEDEAEELKELDELASEISDWKYGETLIDEDDFTEYAQELAEEIGAVSEDNSNWIVIDWEATADNLKADYVTVTYQGTDYLVRA